MQGYFCKTEWDIATLWQGRRSIFRIGGGGGGGGNSNENFKFFCMLCPQNCNVKSCAQSAPQNLKLCMFSSIFYVKFNGFMNFQVVKIIGGGGGGQNDIFATPIFSLGCDCPPPPPTPGSTTLPCGSFWFYVAMWLCGCHYGCQYSKIWQHIITWCNILFSPVQMK